MAGNDRSPVTVIGLGLMGQALAAAFLRGGYPTTVWNRSPEKANDLVRLGAVLAPTPADAVTAGELVVVCLSTYDVMHEILDPLEGALSGRVLANLTSGSSEQARETAAWASERGAEYLDGAIMAIPATIGAAESVLFYSGSRSAFDRHETALKQLGGRTTHVGDDPGLAVLYDVALLGVMWGTLNSFVHGAALLRSANIDAKTFLPWATGWVDAVKLFATDYAGQIDAGDGKYPANDATLSTHFASIEHLLHESEAQGVNTELPTFVHTLVRRAIDKGYGDNSYAAMIELFQDPKAS
ncbi:NAD(P)-dependent oxidoreductase [Streptomyces sp. ST2-7A]|uniref:NAD(P)-dependent oxidoreductase n=1 Tax=Streptomyces sp. ST2-7A TaxID=2907214 RepID=UPI001F22EFDE|nr:NAD(P)-binding domain-containing protein [Streptomyces sp. ST2-7A]MCE7080343.1 NAD(P)-binding domain-containing protein [Streptomyces sp. ST2-7A]